MKKLLAMLPVCALAAMLFVGCGGDEEGGDSDTSQNDTSNVDTTNASHSATCGQCGQDAEEECCASGEDCDNCEFKQGSTLCCTDVEPIDGVFCACGFEKGSESCCTGDDCSDCGRKEGSPLCCVEGSEDSVD